MKSFYLDYLLKSYLKTAFNATTSFLESCIELALKAILPWNIKKSAATDFSNENYFTSEKKSAIYTKNINANKDVLLLNNEITFNKVHIKSGEHLVINATKVTCQSSTLESPNIHIIKGVDYNWSKSGCQFIGKVHYDEIGQVNSLAEHLEL